MKWQVFAECVGQSGLFDDERKATVEAAKLVCARCQVIGECLEDALARDEPWGVWGGMTTIERRKVLKARKAA